MKKEKRNNNPPPPPPRRQRWGRNAFAASSKDPEIQGPKKMKKMADLGMGQQNAGNL